MFTVGQLGPRVRKAFIYAGLKTKKQSFF